MYLPISFSSKRVLVVGAGRGLGKEIVKSLVACQAKVFALSKTQSNLDALKKELPQVTTFQADVENWKETREIVKSIGTVHHLVNNAGINMAGKILDITPEDFDKTMHVNLRSCLNVSQVVLEDMLKRDEGGSIVNVGSVGVKLPTGKQGLYQSSKAALDLLSKVMSTEMGKHNIRVNTIHPGLFSSDMSKKTFEHPTGRFYTANMERQHLKRILTKEEIVNAILFLLSDYSSAITGQSIFACGGISSS